MMTKKKTIGELRQELQQLGLEAKGRKARVVELAKAANLSLTKTLEKIKPGWVGKAKGMLQVSFERGWIDSKKYDPQHNKAQQYYTVDGRKDECGNSINDSSLRRRMEQMPDFVGEETLLQFHGRKIGVIIDHSPKAHPEVAGEGVEYDWGFTKMLYRRQHIEKKRSKEKFRQLVSHCISREVVTVEHRRKFARRARRYLLAYLALAKFRKEASDDDGKKASDDTMSAALIEKIVKLYKNHRSIFDQEKGFITKVLKEMKQIEIKVREEEEVEVEKK